MAKLVPFLNGTLIELTEPMLGFFEFFGKEQLSVTASRGVSLMPQLKTAKPAGPQSTVPYFTCFKGIVCFKCNTYSYQLGIRSKHLEISCQTVLFLPKVNRVLGIKSKQLEISCQTVLFLPKVNQHNEPRSKLSKSH